MEATLKNIVNHPEHRNALKRYYEHEAGKWLLIANNLCDGSEENLPRYAYAMKKHNDFQFDASRL